MTVYQNVLNIEMNEIIPKHYLKPYAYNKIKTHKILLIGYNTFFGFHDPNTKKYYNDLIEQTAMSMIDDL